jgi:hypothetical protein
MLRLALSTTSRHSSKLSSAPTPPFQTLRSQRYASAHRPLPSPKPASSYLPLSPGGSCQADKVNISLQKKGKNSPGTRLCKGARREKLRPPPRYGRPVLPHVGQIPRIGIPRGPSEQNCLFHLPTTGIVLFLKNEAYHK